MKGCRQRARWRGAYGRAVPSAMETPCLRVVPRCAPEQPAACTSMAGGVSQCCAVMLPPKRRPWRHLSLGRPGATSKKPGAAAPPRQRQRVVPPAEPGRAAQARTARPAFAQAARRQPHRLCWRCKHGPVQLRAAAGRPTDGGEQAREDRTVGRAALRRRTRESRRRASATPWRQHPSCNWKAACSTRPLLR